MTNSTSRRLACGDSFFTRGKSPIALTASSMPERIRACCWVGCAVAVGTLIMRAAMAIAAVTYRRYEIRYVMEAPVRRSARADGERTQCACPTQLSASGFSGRELFAPDFSMLRGRTDEQINSEVSWSTLGHGCCQMRLKVCMSIYRATTKISAAKAVVNAPRRPERDFAARAPSSPPSTPPATKSPASGQSTSPDQA